MSCFTDWLPTPTVIRILTLVFCPCDVLAVVPDMAWGDFQKSPPRLSRLGALELKTVMDEGRVRCP